VPIQFLTVFYHSQAVRNAFIKVKGGKIINIGSIPQLFVTINYGIDRAGRRNG
jgi:NADP-dependent 3-hydroxy acid dehydrogenase YdfG